MEQEAVRTIDVKTASLDDIQSHVEARYSVLKAQRKAFAYHRRMKCDYQARLRSIHTDTVNRGRVDKEMSKFLARTLCDKEFGIQEDLEYRDFLDVVRQVFGEHKKHAQAFMTFIGDEKAWNKYAKSI